MNLGGKVVSAGDTSVVIDINRPADPVGRYLVTIRNVQWGSRSLHPPSLPPSIGTSVCATIFVTPAELEAREFDFGKVFFGECTMHLVPA
ncbi:MAG TPA: hypothetical protein VGB19_06390 [Actinomycetota bacterium]